MSGPKHLPGDSPTDELQAAMAKAIIALRQARDAGEAADRAMIALEDAQERIDAEGKAGPWVIVYGEPGPGALYYRGGHYGQTANILDADRFDVHQRAVRSINRRSRCIRLEDARAAIAKAKGGA